MAKLVVEKKIIKAHKEHNECKGLLNPFLKGLLAEADYCPECGEYLVIEKEITEYTCSNCGKFLFGHPTLCFYKYCPYCGVRFNHD